MAMKEVNEELFHVSSVSVFMQIYIFYANVDQTGVSIVSMFHILLFVMHCCLALVLVDYNTDENIGTSGI